jgi:hypothetical protein
VGLVKTHGHRVFRDIFVFLWDKKGTLQIFNSLKILGGGGSKGLGGEVGSPSPKVFLKKKKKKLTPNFLFFISQFDPPNCKCWLRP